MDRTKAIDILRKHADALKDRGVTGMYLFGSVARGDQTPASDIDIFFDYHQDGHFSLFEMMDVQELVEDILQAKADVVPKNSLHPRIRDKVAESAIKVF